jgi:hypothetical protein
MYVCMCRIYEHSNEVLESQRPTRTVHHFDFGTGTWNKPISEAEGNSAVYSMPLGISKLCGSEGCTVKGARVKVSFDSQNDK